MCLGESVGPHWIHIQYTIQKQIIELRSIWGQGRNLVQWKHPGIYKSDPSSDLLMTDREPEPATSCNQARLLVEGLGHHQNYIPTTCPACKMCQGKDGTETVGLANQWLVQPKGAHNWHCLEGQTQRLESWGGGRGRTVGARDWQHRKNPTESQGQSGPHGSGLGLYRYVTVV